MLHKTAVGQDPCFYGPAPDGGDAGSIVPRFRPWFLMCPEGIWKARWTAHETISSQKHQECGQVITPWTTENKVQKPFYSTGCE